MISCSGQRVPLMRACPRPCSSGTGGIGAWQLALTIERDAISQAQGGQRARCLLGAANPNRKGGVKALKLAVPNRESNSTVKTPPAE